MSFKLSYNSPVILTFSIISISILLISVYVFDLTPIFALPGSFMWKSPLNYLQLFSYSVTHATSSIQSQSNFGHFLGNFSIILIIGPILEEKYGSKKLLNMIIMTTLVIAALHICTSEFHLLGASGIAFMFMILASLTNFQQGSVPLTFIIICLFFLGNELLGSFQKDDVSHLSHLAGGICGAIFGFYYKKTVNK